MSSSRFKAMLKCYDNYIASLGVFDLFYNGVKGVLLNEKVSRSCICIGSWPPLLFGVNFCAMSTAVKGLFTSKSGLSAIGFNGAYSSSMGLRICMGVIQSGSSTM